MPRGRPLSSERFARCPAAGSLCEALNKAVSIVCLEFRLPGDRPPSQGRDCFAIRAWWDGEKASILSLVGGGERRRYRAAAVLKSCSRLFDTPCPRCDKKGANRAREEWYQVTGTDRSEGIDQRTSWSKDPIDTLKRVIRELVGVDWARGIRRGEAIPDQQGCLENRSMTGGTFGVGFGEDDSPANHVRVGVAKTKGKLRTVTMQSARVKRVLTPVHDALYTYLSSFGWIVRGELTKGHLLPVVDDLRPGETYISGDYKSATDNLHYRAVHAVVEVLCEAKHLTDEERDTLMASFTDLKRVSMSGKCYPILQGSMMGNLCSFPILCLMNKACHDISRDSLKEGRLAGEKDRKVRINGDDIVTCGSNAFFSRWKEVTLHYGFIINEEKTGRSRRWLELNSRQYDTRKHRFVAKPVLSFLRRSDSPGDLLSEVVKGVATLRRDVVWHVLNVVMRHEISLREISVSTLPKWIWNGLIKKRWFRTAISSSPCEVKSTGVDRSYPTVVGPVPNPAIWGLLDSLEEKIIRPSFVRKWRGVKVPPLEKSIIRKSRRAQLALLGGCDTAWHYTRSSPEWAWLWPKELLSFVRSEHPEELMLSCKDEWLDEHPRLTTRVSLERKEIRKAVTLPSFSTPPCLLAGVNRDGFILFPNGFV